MAVVVPKFSVKEFAKTMNNVIDYSIGFLDGTQKGKNEFLKQLGNMTIEGLKRFIDIQAKLSPGALHHVYEWYKVGSPKGRLYDITMVTKGDSIMFNSSFSQSRTLKKGSSEPFYDKAAIMENGISVTIEPKNAKVLAFQIDGEDVFTPNPVTVDNPGGDDVEGSYEKVFNSFFKNYFSQSFLVG